MADELAEDAPLSAEEILTFGACVEAQVWTTSWLQEARAPIAVAAGQPKFGKVFNDQGVGKMVTIRPCMSRGKRLRGLPPVYTGQMLEKNASVFDGWPMFMDHVPAELAATVAKHGRSVKELGGQVLKGHWSRDFVQESDSEFGYQKGGVIAEVWATPLIRQTVGENPNLLHTSINAWPTSGKPGAVPWRPSVKGMVIEGIRRQPQGSVDYVVRGGAGGRLLVAEGLEEEGVWPEIGEWETDDTRFVVSLAESFYASRRMDPVTLPTKPEGLRDFLAEHAAHLLPALDAAPVVEADAQMTQVQALMKQGKSMAEAWKIVKAKGTSSDDSTQEGEVTLTTEQVQQMIRESQQGQPTVEEFQQSLEERAQELITERETQRGRSDSALALIESAEGIGPKAKAALKARYSLVNGEVPATLLAESATDDKGETVTAEQVLEARVTADIQATRDMLAEATGKPRVRGEGGAKRDPADGGKGSNGKASTPYWRQAFADMGMVESADKALEVFGAKVTGD